MTPKYKQIQQLTQEYIMHFEDNVSTAFTRLKHPPTNRLKQDLTQV